MDVIQYSTYIYSKMQAIEIRILNVQTFCFRNKIKLNIQNRMKTTKKFFTCIELELDILTLENLFKAINTNKIEMERRINEEKSLNDHYNYVEHFVVYSIFSFSSILIWITALDTLHMAITW